MESVPSSPDNQAVRQELGNVFLMRVRILRNLLPRYHRVSEMPCIWANVVRW